MYLGLDCGTSGLKALLTDERGAPVAARQRAYSPDRPHAGWSEQDPDVWAAAMAGAIADIRNSAGKALGALTAIGFSGQMHGAVLLDRARQPVRPAILHNDARAYAEARNSGRDHPGLARVVGVKPMPGFTGPKLKWIARHEPDNLRAASPGSCRRRTICASARRRPRHRHERRGRDVAPRRGGAGLVGGSVRSLRSRARLGAASDRGVGTRPADRAQSGRRTRPAARRHGGGGRRRRGGRRDRPRRDRVRAKPSFRSAPRPS